MGKNKRAIWILSAALLICSLCFLPEAADAETEVTQAETLDEFIEATETDLDLKEITVNKESGDTSEGPFEEVFGEALPENEGDVKKAIEGAEGFMITDETKNSLQVLSNFAAKRIIVLKELSDLYGAKEGASYDGQTILTYETESEAKEAYEILSCEFGEENVLPDAPVIASAPKSWGTSYMNLDTKSASMNGNGTPVTVAVIDSGIKKSHGAFSGKTFLSTSKSFVGDNSPLTDEYGHGTCICGLISESVPNSVRFMSLKIINERGSGTLSDLVNAIDYAQEQNVDVINISVVTGASYGTAFSYVDIPLRKAAEKGIITIASSGNMGSNMDKTEWYPAESPFTICVGSINQKSIVSPFSNYGSNLDFVAPGESITVASTYGDQRWDNGGAGTSYSAPYISACAAILKLENKTLGYQQIKDKLIAMSVDLGTKGKDIYYGYGVPKFPAAKTASKPGTPSISACKWKKAGGSFKASVTWKKPSGATSYQAELKSTKKNKNGIKYSKTITTSKLSYTFGKEFSKKKKTSSTVKIRVRAKGTSGYGSWSAWKTVK